MAAKTGRAGITGTADTNGDTITLTGRPARKICVQNTGDTNDLSVQVPALHGTAAGDRDPLGPGEVEYYEDPDGAGITALTIKGVGGSTTYVVSVVSGNRGAA